MLRPRRMRLGWPLALVIAAGCAGSRAARVQGATPREMLVEVLPRAARVRLDGRPLGPANLPVPAPAPAAGPHVLAVEADGYEPAERALPDGDLAGVRVGVALRPARFASARALDYDEAEGPAEPAAFLARAGEHRDAADYAARAAELEAGLALPRRVLGDALFHLGERERAIASWEEYLRLSPGAPDAAEVSDRIDEAREDVTVK